VKNGIEVSFEYGGLTLACDRVVFARLCALIRAEAGVVDPSSGPVTEPGVKFVRVIPASASSESAPPRLGWGSLIMTLIACCFSGAVYITGLVVIIQWLMRRFA
jgi:hypothetical protein